MKPYQTKSRSNKRVNKGEATKRSKYVFNENTSQTNYEYYLNSSNYPKETRNKMLHKQIVRPILIHQTNEKLNSDHYLDSPNNQKKRHNMVLHKQNVSTILTHLSNIQILSTILTHQTTKSN